jgi:sporulation protein YlmC with PRC-barrel domain
MITTDDILGKDVVDKQGDIIGVLQKIHIEEVAKIITGITVDQGFMKPDIFIGIEHIKTFGVDTVFLKSTPFQKIKGMQVFDAKGNKIGIVSKVTTMQKTGLVKEIQVKKRFQTEFYSSKEIKSIGTNVLLK